MERPPPEGQSDEMNYRVVVIQAPTGSGKSTLVPQFLRQTCADRKRQVRIVVTQPRRAAAISLARRLAEQTGTPLGSFAGLGGNGVWGAEGRSLPWGGGVGWGGWAWGA